jgi:hypothetical protein
MKVIVNRRLASGLYWLDFAVSDYTPEELKKMESFGVPTLDILFGPNPGQRQPVKLPMTQLSQQHKVNFPTAKEATEYEQRVVNQIRSLMQALRERKDDYSSTEEVSI